MCNIVFSDTDFSNERPRTKKKRSADEIAEVILSKEVTPGDVSRFAVSAMRRFAFGCLFYTPDRFGLMRVGDFLDTMAGYREGENERIKSIAELVRTSTSILWNIQVSEESRLSPIDLWPFSWDKNMSTKTEVISDEEIKRREAAAEKFLNDNFSG